mgnify:CR=1 FL=1
MDASIGALRFGGPRRPKNVGRTAILFALAILCGVVYGSSVATVVIYASCECNKCEFDQVK